MAKLSWLSVAFILLIGFGFGSEETSLQAALERSYIPSKNPEGMYRIVKVIGSDPQTGRPEEQSAQVYCADVILSRPTDVFPEPIPPQIMELSTKLVRGKALAEKEINVVFSSLNRPLSFEDRKVLYGALEKFGVFQILTDYVIENRKNSDSPLSICTRFWISGPRRWSELPGWKQLVDVCTTESPDFRDHIMFHDSPEFHPSIRKAGKLLSSMPEFRECLEEVAEKIPVINKMISQVTIAAPSEMKEKVKNEVWRAWEAAGVPQIVDEAGKEKPDQEKISRLIKACRSKAGVAQDSPRK